MQTIFRRCGILKSPIFRIGMLMACCLFIGIPTRIAYGGSAEGVLDGTYEVRWRIEGVDFIAKIALRDDKGWLKVSMFHGEHVSVFVEDATGVWNGRNLLVVGTNPREAKSRQAVDFSPFSFVVTVPGPRMALVIAGRKVCPVGVIAAPEPLVAFAPNRRSISQNPISEGEHRWTQSDIERERARFDREVARNAEEDARRAQKQIADDERERRAAENRELINKAHVEAFGHPFGN